MAKKVAGPVDPLKAKEARQKKIAIGGAVLLVLVLAIQVPKLMKMTSRSAAPPPPPATTVTAPSVTAPTDTSSATPSAGLASDVAPTAAVGQLSSFGSFVSKDPFASQGPAPGAATAAPGGPKTPTTAKPPTVPTPPAPPTTPSASLTTAVISVNGVKETATVGADFPAQQPFFHLISVSAHSAKISIAGGSLADGTGTLTLQEGKALTLQNTSDGARYTIVLWPQGTTVPAAGTSTGAAGTTATSTGTTTASTTTGK